MMLRIRKSSPLFSLESADEVQKRVVFLNADRGEKQIPGLIVMQILDTVAPKLDKSNTMIVAVFNVTMEPVVFKDAKLKNLSLILHPELEKSSDKRIKEAKYDKTSGSITIPPQTTIVYCGK